MQDKKNIITHEGVKKYEDELEQLKKRLTVDIAQKIKEARQQGDLSENAEYDAAKDEQRDVAARIEELEKMLKNAEVVDVDEVDTSTINIGCKAKILDMEFDEEVEYDIVGSHEANSLEGRISNDSPIGAALMGREQGEKVTAVTPAGEFAYEILSVER